MEHKVIMNLRMVNGDKSLFRQWHQRFITALGQVGGAHEEIVRQVVKEMGLGRELDKVVDNFEEQSRRGVSGEFQEMFEMSTWTKRRTRSTTRSRARRSADR